MQVLAPGIAAEGLSDPELAALRRIVTFVKGHAPGKSPPDVPIRLVFTGAASACARWRKQGVCAIHLGHGGALRLPQDQDTVAAIVSQSVVQRSGARLLVASWSPEPCGAVAWNLAKTWGGPLIDVRGRGPGHLSGDSAPHGLVWADLDPTERTFPFGIDQGFACRLGVPILGADNRGGVFADHPLVGPVLDAISNPMTCVIDAGVWDDRAARGARHADALVLTGAGCASDALELASAVATWPSPVPTALLIRGSVWPGFRSVAAHTLATWPYPKGVRGWRKTASAIDQWIGRIGDQRVSA